MSIRKLTEELAALVQNKVWVVAPHMPVDALQLPTNPTTIRAWWNPKEQVWEAVEGSHRLAVAAKTDTPVIIVPVELDDYLLNQNLDGSDVIGIDPTLEEISVADVLKVFRDYGDQTSKRPGYYVTVTTSTEI